jgi:predicted membrane protein
MHIPVLLAGYLCGPWWALAVGLIAPLLRHLLFAMPPLITAIAMCFELATYGLVSGLLFKALPKKTVSIYISLIAAMLAGRVVWGVVRVLLSGVSGEAFTWEMFLAGAFINAVPGIIVHILLIPVIVLALEKAGIIQK